MTAIAWHLVEGADDSRAPKLSWRARRFREEPTAESLAAVLQTLDATRSRLRETAVSFLREARAATNAAVQLLQLGRGGAEVLMPVADLEASARRIGAHRLARTCMLMREQPFTFFHCAVMLASISAAARDTVEAAVGGVDCDMPSDDAILFLAKHAVLSEETVG